MCLLKQLIGQKDKPKSNVILQVTSDLRSPETLLPPSHLHAGLFPKDADWSAVTLIIYSSLVLYLFLTFAPNFCIFPTSYIHLTIKALLFLFLYHICVQASVPWFCLVNCFDSFYPSPTFVSSPFLVFLYLEVSNKSLYMSSENRNLYRECSFWMFESLSHWRKCTTRLEMCTCLMTLIACLGWWFVFSRAWASFITPFPRWCLKCLSQMGPC